jgi:NitT/TauT family transport system permease protein
MSQAVALRGAASSGSRRRPSRLSPAAQRRLLVLAQAAIIAVLLLLWELTAGDPRKGALVDEFFIGRPSRILSAIGGWWNDGTLVRQSTITIQEGLIGFAIGSLSGIVLGFAVGVSGVGRAVLGPLVYTAYAMPRIGFAPLFILWFGLGMESKIALVVTLVFFLTFFNTYEGAREVDPELMTVCRMMKASRWQMLMKVTVPSAMVWAATGLKVSVPYAFVGAVVGEILAGNLGLGGLITRAVNTFDPNRLMAAVFLTTFMAIILNTIVGRLTGYLLRWQEAGGSGGRL